MMVVVVVVVMVMVMVVLAVMTVNRGNMRGDGSGPVNSGGKTRNAIG